MLASGGVGFSFAFGIFNDYLVKQLVKGLLGGYYWPYSRCLGELVFRLHQVTVLEGFNGF